MESLKYDCGIEQVEPGKWLTWVFDLPGCYAKGESRSSALAAAAGAIVEYLNWLEGYERINCSDSERIEIHLDEEFQNFATGDGYWVNAFFEHDRRALSETEIDRAIWLLHCTRNDLGNVIRAVPPAALERPIAEERFGSLQGILNHIAGAEWWYFDKFRLACDWESLPADVSERLRIVREHSLQQLPLLVNNTEITEERQELWSARKIVRRMLWHERVHTRHLARRLAEMKQQAGFS